MTSTPVPGPPGPVPDRPDPDDLARIQDAFVAADYTSAGVDDRLGAEACAALARHETVPARRRCADGSPLATLIRLFLLQDAVQATAAQSALPLEPAIRLGLIESAGAQVRARLDARPHDESCYVVSDLGTGLDGEIRPLAADHVLGVGGASVSLAELTVRDPVARALDLGTGCGVQALHLAAHAGEVVATDVLPRALALARLSAGLSGVPVDLRLGSMFEAVPEQRFDLIVSNPPFVMGAAEGIRRTYRDSGAEGDEIGRRLIAAAPDYLTERGWCQVLTNWMHRRGEDWRDRVGSWLPEDCDGWVLQRECLDPAAYVSLWLHDAGDVGSAVGAATFRARYDAWLRTLEDAGVEAIGFGWICLRRAGGDGVHRVEDWPHGIAAPVGPHIRSAFARLDWLRARDDRALVAERLVIGPGLTQELVGEPGAEDPLEVVLRQSDGLRRARSVDTATAALVGACTGEAALGALLDGVATVLAEDAERLSGRTLPLVRQLVAEGYLEPAPGSPTAPGPVPR